MSTWVLLRGLTRESRHWGDFPAALRDAVGDVRIVTPDLPGNGRHNDLRSPMEVAAMVEHCRAELAAEGVAPPYRLLAMSLGAMVAIAWAQRYPGELSGCALINTSLRPFSPFYERLRPRNYAALLGLAVSSGARRERSILRLTSSREHGEAVLAAWTAFQRERPVSRLNALRQLVAAARFRASMQAPRVPLLVLASAGDGFVDPRCSQHLAGQWHASFAMHPTAGHDLPLDDPAWVAQEVRRWLSAT